jgi:hypothetical protein
MRYAVSFFLALPFLVADSPLGNHALAASASICDPERPDREGEKEQPDAQWRPEGSGLNDEGAPA